MQIINLSNLDIQGIKPKIMIFPDSELKVVLEESLSEDNQFVIIVQTDQNPSQMVLVTAMLIEIVSQYNPDRIIIVHPWLSFSRQDQRFMPTEPMSIEIILNLYISVGATDLISIDIHSVQFRNPGIHIFNSKVGSIRIHNLNFIGSFYKDNFSILSPTGTDEPFLSPLRERDIPITYFHKEKYCKNCGRTLQLCKCEGEVIKDVRIVSDENLTGKDILILDDIISGGGTMLSTLKQLKNEGASKIEVVVTHGFFSNLEKADEIIKLADNVKASNTVSVSEKIGDLINIVDVSSLILNYLDDLN
ncbi:MAG: ribose-phosphate diphosphokinase [Candidatus Hodarchaeales archaeon]|jgi:ribose-phosphate pyrophosphokinase